MLTACSSPSSVLITWRPSSDTTFKAGRTADLCGLIHHAAIAPDLRRHAGRDNSPDTRADDDNAEKSLELHHEPFWGRLFVGTAQPCDVSSRDGPISSPQAHDLAPDQKTEAEEIVRSQRHLPKPWKPNAATPVL